MNTTVESRLWLAVHLLYPNSSQAFDVYQAIVLQSELEFKKNNRELVFAKLVSVFDKITAISSSLSFYEFEFDQIDQWKLIYKNSQKIQLIIFVGVLIFELKISEIAQYVKLTEEKALFLFHQMFKKLVQNSSKIKYNEQLSLKKQNDQKVSYLYTYENLIEYCLGQLSDAEAIKVEKGLEIYPILQMARDEYLKVISQIQNLKVQRSSSAVSNNKSKISLVKSNQKADGDKKQKEGVSDIFYRNKKSISGGLISFVAVVAVLIQFGGLGENFFNSEKTVIIHQVEKNPGINLPNSEVALESLPKPTEVVEEATPAAVDVAVKEEKQVSGDPRDKSEPIKSIAPEGGLYRGSMVVKELSISNKKILSKLIGLEAQKAGEVELGWQKSNKVAYYHFTIPEENIEEATAYLAQFGRLNLKFEAHPRLISAGRKRFIIEVRE